MEKLLLEQLTKLLDNTKWQISFLAGYAGTDFIENLYKIKLGQRRLNNN